MKKILIFILLLTSISLSSKDNNEELKKLFQNLENEIFVTYSKDKQKMICNQIISIKANNEYGFLCKAWLAYLNNNYEEAVKEADNSIKKNNKFPAPHLFKGIFHASFKKDIGLIIEEISKAIKIDEKYIYAYYMRAFYYKKQGKNDLALADYKKLIELDKNNPEYYNLLGLFYQEIKDYKEALNYYSQAIKINLKYAGAYINRANTYSWLNDYKNALKDYDYAIKLSPDNSEFYFYRGILYKNHGKWDKAKNDLRMVIKLKGKNAWAAERMITDIDEIYIPESEGKKWNPDTKKYE